ncbi:hypothetical protein LWI28_006216 [Acer negundo]|uniref:Uncharacterized protein n=1 Tax=Acer negundo TaxID=4023 RepID=A0AAD5NWK5_ACENE|nr:hypothetical protein LWI28_006216 [Acer negundo]
MENDLEEEDSDSSEVAPRHKEQEPVESEVLKVQRSTHEKRLPIGARKDHLQWPSRNVSYMECKKDGRIEKNDFNWEIAGI